MVDRENKNDPLRQDNKRPSDRDDRRRIETTRSGKTPAEDRARSSSEERSRSASGDASRRSGPRKSMEDEPRDVSGINPQRTAADTPPPVGNRPRSAAEDRPGRSSSGRNLGEQPPAPQGTTRRTERSAETGSSGRGSGSKRLRQDDREDWSGSSTGSSHRPGILSALFRDRESAEDAYQATLDRDYEPDEVNIVMSKETREQYFHDRSEGKSEMGNKALEGTGAGSAIGGGLGAAAGILAAIGTSITVPGLGLVIAGPLAAGLAGAGAGGITGGIIGALVGAGIPEERAETYESGIDEGHIVLTVRPHSEEDARELEDEWRKHQGEEIHRSLENV